MLSVYLSMKYLVGKKNQRYPLCYDQLVEYTVKIVNRTQNCKRYSSLWHSQFIILILLNQIASQIFCWFLCEFISSVGILFL